MKKGIIIGLIVLVGGAMLIMPLMNQTSEESTPATFTFKENLATIGDQNVQIEIEKGVDVEKLELIYNNETIKTWESPTENVVVDFNPGKDGLGTRRLNLRSTFSDGSSETDFRMVRVLSDITPVEKSVEPLTPYTHNSESFTQGLEFYKGKLYEGTGDPGRQGNTRIAEVNLSTGDHVRFMKLDATYFGEGITILNDQLYQLTWQNGKCFVYDINDFQKIIKEFDYTGEGWGICNNGSSLIMSDGTERITFRNPETFEIEKIIEVYDNQGPVSQLNELEYIDGKIYANVWMTNFVIVIDPSTGKILEKIDASSLVTAGSGHEGVLNGIAYNPETGKLYMTGKNWPKLFEVSIR